MNRIEKKLAELRVAGRKVLSPYITAGDPNPGLTVELMHALVRSGADVLEVGVPFSDPMAEGVVIQQAMERALTHGVTLADVLTKIREFRVQDKATPVVLMGYLNPVEQYGYERFAKDAVACGVDATILVDLPPEESATLHAVWDKVGLYSIYLCSPTTSPARMQLINQWAKGYLYYVSLKGVTGAQLQDMASVQAQYALRKTQTALPVMLGFGIKTPAMAAEVSTFADGVVVGAALITKIIEAYDAKNDPVQAAEHWLRSVRQAMDLKVEPV